MPAHDAETAANRLPPQPRRWAPRAALAVIAVATLLIMLSWALARNEPSWWAAAGVDPATGSDLAERVERAAAGRLHKWEDQGREWTVALTAEQANAWLACRAPKWIANRSPKGVAAELPEIRLRFEDNAVVLAARAPGASRVVSARFSPEIRPDGSLWAGVGRASVGSLPLPASILHAAERSLPPDVRAEPAAARALAGLAGDGPVLERPAVSLEDGRRVRVTSVAVERDRLILTCVTERPEARTP